MGNLKSIEDVLSMLRRRAAVILAILVPGIFMTLVHAMSQPHVYESFAIIQVETPRVAADAARNVSEGRTSQRLRLIEGQVTSRASLLELIEKHGLFSDPPGLTDTEKVGAMRASIQFQVISQTTDGLRGDDVAAMVVRAHLGDRELAATLANDLATSVMALGAERQAERIDETVVFFQREEERIAADIVALEAQITSYKNDNIDALPEGLSARRDALVRLDDSLREVDRRILELERNRSEIEQRATLRAIEQRQIDQIESDLGVLRDERVMLAERRAAIEVSVQRAPEVETTLATFARALQQLQEQYSVAARSLAEAETSRKLVANQQTERFTLLEPAVPADYPLRSSRRKIAVFGTFAALMLALSVALALELRNPVLRSAGQMQRVVDLRPVVAIPYLATPGEVQRRRLLLLIGVSTLAIIALGLLAVMGALPFGG